MYRIQFFTFVLVVLSISTLAATLQRTTQTDAALFSHALMTVPSIADLKTPGILDSGRVTQRPVLYRVVRQSYSESRLREFASRMGVDPRGPIQGDRVRQIENAQKSARVGFREETGAYYFVDNNLEKTPLVKNDSASVAALQNEAEKVLFHLLGAQARNFVFANTVTDYLKTIDNRTPRVCAQAFRFTRKVNGRHSIDNTAYVTIRFSGAAQVSTVEVVNPDLIPVNIERMVKPAATGVRLQQWAAEKKAVTSTVDEIVSVRSIVAAKVVETYVADFENGATILVPHTSIWSTFHLENGDEFEKFVNFSLDAARASNLTSDMIESFSR